MWKRIQSSTGITTNSVGEVIVAKYNRDIVKIDKEGKKTVLVEHSKLALNGCLLLLQIQKTIFTASVF